MISADLAADGPEQMWAKVKCQSTAKHSLFERDIFTAGYKLYVINKRSKEAVDSGVLRCGTANQIGWSLHLLFLPLWKILVNEEDFQMPCGKMLI